ncbi:MAG: phosphoribosylanthranilate isomerase [Gemmatimonadaceae bacterium]|nr:phosphoribosylanthranilate isomerase [Gemmatimonadaceae bacterium]
MTAPEHGGRPARPAIKICGLTQAHDAALAESLGAGYLGGILAGGPRLLSDEQWSEVLGPPRPGVRRVAVFGELDPDELIRRARRIGCDIAQWHGDPTPAAVREVAAAGVIVWPVLRVEGTQLPPDAWALATHARALVLDAKVVGQLGGTGVPLDWAALADDVERWRRDRPACSLVLAGGLHAENVERAIALLRPQIVDVSSGVEAAPGRKDPARLRAFFHAVQGATV